MHMRAAVAIVLVLAPTVALSGCLGVDNMGQLKGALGFGPAALEPGEPLARIRASASMVGVGQAVALSAQDSRDPQGLALAHAWDFGDGRRAEGSEVTHRWAAAGIYTVRLVARSPLGLEGRDTVLITVLDNRPPSAALEVRRDGAAADRALAGEALQFVAAARDPEGQPLALRWDFGDGATALTEEATHSYAAGGRYTVALRAEDSGGLAATAERTLRIDEVRTTAGRVALGEERATHALDVAAHAQAVELQVRFDALFGLNALRVRLLDAQGAEVQAWDAAPAPGAQGAHEAAFGVAADALEGRAPGGWTVAVERASGASVAYDLTAALRY